MFDSTTSTTLLPTVKRFLAGELSLYINGRWAAATSGENFPVYDPADGTELARVPEAGTEDVDAAVRAARHAFEQGPWSTTSAAERAQLVWRIGEALVEAAEELAQIITLENGKPLSDALFEVRRAAEMFRYMAGWATKLEGATFNAMPAAEYHAYSRREPIGVVAAIVPWNFPLGLTSWKLAPALAAGCTVILKPAEETPLAALRLAKLIDQVGVPPGVVNVVTGHGEQAGALLAAHLELTRSRSPGAPLLVDRSSAPPQGT